MLIAIIAHIASPGVSECGWYFVVYFADCTLGLTLAITFHTIVTGMAQRWGRRHAAAVAAELEAGREHREQHPWWEALVEIGNYGDPPSYRKWGIQVVFWMLCVVSARCIVGVVILSSIPTLQVVTTNMDRRFAGHPDLYILTVMVFIPVFINIGQAYIQDQVLKWRHRKASKAKSMDHTLDAAMTLSLQQAEVIASSGGRRPKDGGKA